MKQVTKERIIKNNGVHWNQTEEGREKCRQVTLRLIEQGIINPAITKESPNNCEKKLIELFQNYNINLRFVGDGQIWITSKGKHYNPDFINIQNKKIVEYYGGIGFFHSLEEIEKRHDAYLNIGWDHLAILENELSSDQDKLIEKVKTFMGDVHNGWIISNIEIIKKEQKMINFHCEPNNNFFVNKILTHNSYPDNSERFISSFEKFITLGSIVGSRIKAMYGLCNLLKSEQYILLKNLELLKDLSPWLVSCDRPKVINNIPCNCRKDGKPACGSGGLSYWAAQSAGVDDLRTYYDVEDIDYKLYTPEIKETKEYDINNIIDKLMIPEYNKNKLKNYIKNLGGI